MSNYTVTSKNRGPVKKLLTFAGLPATDVRQMTVSQLSEALDLVVNRELVTRQQVERALGWEKELPETETEKRGRRDDVKTGDSDEAEDKENRNENGGGDSGESESESEGNDGENGEGEAGTGSSESDNENGEGEGEGTGEGDGSEGEGEDGEEKDDDKEGESEGEPEQEDEENEGEGSDPDAPIQHPVFKRVLAYIRAGLNVALVGPAGTGKSFLARQVADELGLDFNVNGAMMSKYDLIGYCDAHGTYHETPAYNAFTRGGLHCFDELDGSAPDAVVAFNGMTDDQGLYTFPNGQHAKHENYVAIACMNTFGNGATSDYVGRYKQDAAAMDRFVKVHVDYDPKVEEKIAGKHKDILQRVRAVRQASNELGIKHICSYRMIKKAVEARRQKVAKRYIDEDIIFAGLDDSAIRQLRTRVNKIIKGGS